MTHGALFNGIGGFQLAASWLGWENVWHSEIDKFCNKVVKQHFPNSICYEDIKQFDAREWEGRIDIISGGFPCQPFSVAGQRKGTEDDRYLWPEMLRIIGEVQPRFIVGENVGGLVNWSNGMVFDQVQTDLENEGYEVASFILPACAVNAPHRRDRIWFVAYASNYGNRQLGESSESNRLRSGHIEKQESRVEHTEQLNELFEILRDGADTERIRSQGQGRPQRQMRSTPNGNWKASWSNDDGRWPTQPAVCGGNDGIPNRMDRIKALGNAIVPQVAYQIFKAIDNI